MIWIRLGVSCIAFLSSAGSISFGMIKLAERFMRIKNPLLLLALQKLSLLLYWLPISFACVCIPRISYVNGVKLYCGEFVCSTVPPMTVAFNVLGGIWLVGFLAAAALSVVKRQSLLALEKGNVPVWNEQYFTVFEECRKQLGVKTVSLYQNDLIASPIATGLFRKRILLPFAKYTDMELRMIYEHELTHIKKKDLFWRMTGLAASWLHWFNPVIYLQQKELICRQEIVCDLSTSIDNAHFTQKEYAAFLAKLTDNEAFSAYTLALTEDKSQTIRRLEELSKTVSLNKPKKRVTGLSCACLVVLTLLPATAASAKAAKLQEDWIQAEETALEEGAQDFSDPSIAVFANAGERVVELDGNWVSVPSLERTIGANAKYIYQAQSMSAGESIAIIAACDDSAAPYRIGIKNMETGVLVSTEGTGTFMHVFEITESGSYAAYIENCSQSSISVASLAAY